MAGEEQITDSASLKKVGNTIADKLKIRRPARWIFRTKKGLDEVEGRIGRHGILYFLHRVTPSIKYNITIIQGTKSYVVANRELVDWYWANNALKVKIGDEVHPNQEMITRVIVHELAHAWQIGEGEEVRHDPKFSKKVQENIIQVLIGG